MNAKIEWDADVAGSESASVAQKLLNKLVPSYNALLDMRAQYKAATDVDGAVTAVVDAADPESEIGKLRVAIEKAHKLIELYTPKMEELARNTAMEQFDPNFDKQKFEANYSDERSALTKAGRSILDTFEILGFVEHEKNEVGKVVDTKALTPDAEILLQVVNPPRLSGTSATAGNSTNGDFGKKVRAWAIETNFVGTDGKAVGTKGKLSNEVKQAYIAAHPESVGQDTEESDDSE